MWNVEMLEGSSGADMIAGISLGIKQPESLIQVKIKPRHKEPFILTNEMALSGDFFESLNPTNAEIEVTAIDGRIDSEFLFSIPQAKLENDDKILSLPDGIFFDDDVYKSYSRVYVRSCYPKLAEVFAESNFGSMILTGSPGFGKTFFGWYFMWWIVKDAVKHNRSQKIFYHTAKGIVAAFFDSTGRPMDVFQCSKEQLQQWCDKSSWYIVDTCEPFTVDAGGNALLITSPKEERYKEWAKQRSAVKFYIPNWTEEELEECRQLLYSDVDKEIPAELSKDAPRLRTECFGLIPRVVFERKPELLSERYKQIVTSISNLTPKSLPTDVWANVVKGSDFSQLFIVYGEEKSKWQEPIIDYASQFILTSVHKYFEHSHQMDLEDFLLLTSLPWMDKVQGHHFETHSHWLLRQGGKFQFRRLFVSSEESGDVHIVKVDPMKPMPFTSEDISPKDPRHEWRQ